MQLMRMDRFDQSVGERASGGWIVGEVVHGQVEMLTDPPATVMIAAHG